MKSFKLLAIFSVLFFVLASVSAFAQAAITPAAPYANNDLACSVPGSNAAYIYKWFKDGQAQTFGKTVPYNYLAHGQTWKCRVYLPPTPHTGSILIGEASATILNSPPAVNANGPYNAVEGTAVNFAGSAVDSVDNDAINSYSWDFGDGANSNLQNPAHTYTADGIYTVTLSAADSLGAQGTASTTATIADTAPTADFSISQNPVNEGVSVRFTDLSAAGYDPIASYSWNFGDGQTSSLQNPSHTYAQNGNHNIVLTVTDNDGSAATRTRAITINDLSPSANAGADRTVQEGTSVAFNGAASTVYDTPLSYSWRLANGTVIGTSANPTYTFNQNGAYTVTLTVTDNDGSIATDNVVITVTDTAPAANAGADQTAVEGTPVTFNGAGSTGYDTPLTYSWRRGNGTFIGTGVNPAYTFTQNRNYSVILTVTDSDGSTATDNVRITITDTAPIATAGADQTVAEGNLVTFDGSASTGYDTPLSYSWRLANGTVIRTTVNPSYTFNQNGAYTVTLTVIDNDGSTATDNVVITVTDASPATPTGLTATAISSTQIDLNWTASAGAASYNVYYSPTGANGTFTTLVASPATNSYSVTSLNASTTYYYKVQAVNAFGNSPRSSIVSATTLGVAPAAPTGLIATAVSSSRIDLNWTASAGATSYNVYYSPTGANGTFITLVASPATNSYSVTSLNASTTYYYRVQAVNAFGSSARSNIASAVTFNNAPVLNAIGNQNINEGQLLTFTVSASDPDSDPLTFTAAGLPAGAAFNATSRIFAWTPDFAQSGNYSVTFNVTDGIDSDSETINIEVFDVVVPGNNQPAFDTSAVNTNVLNNTLFVFDVNASDADAGDVLTYSDNLAQFDIDPSTGLISFTPSVVETINGQITVCDDSGAANNCTTQLFTLDVTAPANNAPAFTTPEVNASVQNNTLFTFNVDASDIDVGDVLSFSDDASQFDIDSASGLISFTPNAVELITATITVCDDSGAANNCTTQAFTLDVSAIPVNNQPTIDTAAVNTNVAVNTSFVFDVNASDFDVGDVLTYSDDASQFNIDANTGLISFTPSVVETINAVLTVCDNSGFPNNCTTQAFTLNVTPLPSPTILVNEFEQNPLSGSEWVELYNPNGFSVDISGWRIWDGLVTPTSKHTVPASTVLAANSYYSANVTGLNNGGEFVTLYDNSANLVDNTSTLSKNTASDNCWARVPNGVDTNTIADWTFQACSRNATNDLVPGNNAPVFATAPVNGAVQNSTLFTFDIDATDADIGDVLTFSDDASQFDIDSASGLINFTPNAVELITATITVCDDSGAANNCTTQAFTLDVSAIPVNNQPTIDTAAVNTNIHLGTLFAFDINASDIDAGQNLTYSDDASQFDIDSASGLISFTPNVVELITATITVCDDSGFANNCTTQAFSLDVTNNAPVLNAIGNQTVDENSTLSFVVNATDADPLDVLTYSAAGLPVGAVFDNATQTFSWTPDFMQSGNYSVEFNVTDEHGAVDSETITIAVENVVQNGTIAGFVFEQDGITPLGLANVEIKNGSLTIASDITDAVTGVYSVDLQPGTYGVLVYKAGFVDNLTSGIVVAELNVTQHNASLSPVMTTGNLTGRISDVSNNDIYGAAVQLRQGEAVIASMTTGADGLYSFADENAGSYSLVVAKPGFDASTTSVTITAGSSATQNVSLTAGASSGRITGEVKDGSNNPISAVTNVTIIKTISREIVQIVQTDGTGAYTINGLLPTGADTYDVTADLIAGYSTVFRWAGQSLSAGETKTFNIYEI